MDGGVYGCDQPPDLCVPTVNQPLQPQFLPGGQSRILDSSIQGRFLAVVYTHPKGGGRATLRAVKAVVLREYPDAKLSHEHREFEVEPPNEIECRTWSRGKSIASFRVK